jgi:hypothetical protein
MTWPFYSIAVQGFAALIYQAETRGQALSLALRDYRNCDHGMTHEGFKRIASARKVSAPADDLYGGVRRQYDVDPKIGQRITLKNEGPGFNGRCGTVLYPNGHTSSIHVLVDGMREPLRVHPLNVAFTPDPIAAPLAPSSATFSPQVSAEDRVG